MTKKIKPRIKRIATGNYEVTWGAEAKGGKTEAMLQDVLRQINDAIPFASEQASILRRLQVALLTFEGVVTYMLRMIAERPPKQPKPKRRTKR